jgi:Flp pilus assembly protein CpaB
MPSAIPAWVQSVIAGRAARRRLMAAALVGLAVVCGLDAVRPSAPPTREVWVAAHDLPGGQPLQAADVRTERLPVADVPAGALAPGHAPIGRMLAAPMRTGEPITDVRLLSASLLAASATPGDVAVPVRVADGPAATALVHPGDVIDVLAAADPDQPGPQRVLGVVHDVRVLAVSSAGASDTVAATGSDGPALLIVEADATQAAALARAATGARLSIAVRGPA